MSAVPASLEAVTDRTVLAFDFGLRRIGVAVGNAALGIAHPLEKLSASNDDERFARIAQLIDEWRPAALLVGLPLTENDGDNAITPRCRRFARQLEGRFRLPVTLADERYTSAVADDKLAAARMPWRERKDKVDSLAAQILLQAYFDEQR